MNKLLLLLLPVLLTGLSSCGGGGGSTTTPEPITATIITTTSPISTNTNLFQTLVIDGYVDGANVFVDFNFNLIQDEGEPSGVFNNTTYEYEFDSTEFSAITNFTETCGLNRPRIAQVPVGAIDSTRGYVETAYTMMYFPHDGGTPKANVTPFTTLLVDSINRLLSDTSITVANGCASTTNSLANDIQTELNTVLTNLESNFQVGRNYFYDDFIASEDTTQQAVGEKIVDFLGTLHATETLLKETYNMGFRGMLNDEVITLILNNTPFESVTLDIQNQTVSLTQEDDHFRYNRRHNFNGLTVNSQGQILDNNNTPIEITLENLNNNAEVHISENYEEFNDTTPIVEGKRIHISVQERLGIHSQTFIRYIPTHGTTGPTIETAIDHDSRSISTKQVDIKQSFEIDIMSTTNPNHNYDITNIMSTRYPLDLQSVYTSITNESIHMIDVPTTINTLYASDTLVIEGLSNNFFWRYRYDNYSQGVEERCEQRDPDSYDLLEYTTGTDAYNTCSEHL